MTFADLPSEPPDQDAPVWYNSDMASSWEAGRRSGWTDALARFGGGEAKPDGSFAENNLHDARRPKPPSLKQQALDEVSRLERNFHVSPVLRQFLETISPEDESC